VNIPLRARLTTLLFPRLRDVFVELEGVRGERDRFQARVTELERAAKAIPTEVARILALYHAPQEWPSWTCDVCGGVYPRDIIVACPECSDVARVALAPAAPSESDEDEDDHADEPDREWLITDARDGEIAGVYRGRTEREAIQAAQAEGWERCTAEPYEATEPEEERADASAAPSPESLSLARDALAALDARHGESAEAWANRLADAAFGEPPTPKPGDLVTGEMVEHLPIGCVIEWPYNGQTWTAERIDSKRRPWRTREDVSPDDPHNDHHSMRFVVLAYGARIHTLPPTAEEARPTPSGCAGCTFDTDDGWTCAIPLDHPKNTAAMAWIGSFGQGACPAHTPRNPPGCGVGGEGVSR
jgi:hypothetical protein